MKKQDIPTFQYRYFRKGDRAGYGSVPNSKGLKQGPFYRCVWCRDLYFWGLSGEPAANPDDLYVGALTKGWRFSWTGQMCGRCSEYNSRRFWFRIASWMYGPVAAALYWLFAFGYGATIITLTARYFMK